MRDNLQPVGLHRARHGHFGRDVDDRAGGHLESAYAEKAAKLRSQEDCYNAYARQVLREHKSSSKRLTLDKTKSRSAGNPGTRYAQSAKKADAIKKMEDASRRLAEWQRDYKPDKADYSRTPSRVDTGLNKTALMQQTDRSPASRNHQTHQRVPRTVSANVALRKDLSRPEILKPSLQAGKRREATNKAFNDNSALQRLTGLAERKSLKERATDTQNQDMDHAPTDKYSRRFSASINSYRKALAANLTRNTKAYKAKHLETETATSASKKLAKSVVFSAHNSSTK